MRKLATIRTIAAIDPIEDADKIEVATVGGWKVVVGKGEFQVGEQAIYCEIDSWIPHDLAPFLSRGQEPREYEGIKGERLRTATLRKQLSQGLLLPIELISFSTLPYEDGVDVADYLGIIKYEPPIPACLHGSVKGGIPGEIIKTDQDRIQNLTRQLAEWNEKGLSFEVTEKLEGTSMTVYFLNGVFGVCGHNWEYLPTEGNTYWKVAIANDLERKLREYGGNIALQGELVGEGIQGNYYKLKGQEFYLFDILDLDTRTYMSRGQRRSIQQSLDIKHVPEIHYETIYTDSVDSLLYAADGMSELNKNIRREGLVFKCIEDPQISFKVVSNKFLLKQEK